MALSVDYLFTFCKKLVRKNQAGGLTNTDFEYHWNDQSNGYQDDMLGRFQVRSNGKTGTNTGLIEDETILQKLSPFTKPILLTIMAGNSTIPADLVYRLALRINGKDVFKINQNQIVAVNDSVIDPPSIENNKFYFVNYQDYYYFLPHTLPSAGITSADLDYISTPVNIKWGYTWDDDGRQIYNSSLSVQPQWDANSCREITKRVLTNLGVSFKDADFANFGKSAQLTGE